MRIAIGQDLVEKATDGNPQSFSALWKAQAEAMGVEAEVIDPLLPGAIGRIGGFDGFIWRYNFRLPWTEAGPRIMEVVEAQHGLVVWPPRVLRETFENKVAQAYVMDALDVPRPRSWVFWHEADARAALAELPMPLVAKLSRGVRGEGVAMLRTRAEAERLIHQMFSFGLGSMDYMRGGKARRWGRYSPMVEVLRRGRFKGNHERGYVLFQEFLEGNSFDTRVVIQGDRGLGEPADEPRGRLPGLGQRGQRLGRAGGEPGGGGTGLAGGGRDGGEDAGRRRDAARRRAGDGRDQHLDGGACGARDGRAFPPRAGGDRLGRGQGGLAGGGVRGLPGRGAGAGRGACAAGGR